MTDSAGLVGDVDTPTGDGFALWFDREQWGVIFDGLILERARSDQRKVVNAESASDLRVDMCGELLMLIGERAQVVSGSTDNPTSPEAGDACICARLLPVSESARPRPVHGLSGDSLVCGDCHHNRIFHTDEGDCMGPGCFCDGFQSLSSGPVAGSTEPATEPDEKHWTHDENRSAWSMRPMVDPYVKAAAAVSGVQDDQPGDTE